MRSNIYKPQVRSENQPDNAHHHTQLASRVKAMPGKEMPHDLNKLTLPHSIQRQLQAATSDTIQSKRLQSLQGMTQSGTQARQLKALEAMIKAPTLQRAEQDEELVQKESATTTDIEEEQPLQAHSATTQLMEEEETLQGQFADTNTQRLATDATTSATTTNVAATPNHTGLPDNLKSGIESLSGMSMDHVRVHYNSAQPAQLNAHAYAQGSEIHVAPGQEQHLPHEAWHVVQQAQGRVKPTLQMQGGVPINDDLSLESEADVMGARALSTSTAPAQRKVVRTNRPSIYTPVQRLTFYHGGGKGFVESAIANPHTAKASEGELGSKGMYYWKDDENAALISAIIYNAANDWAVMKIDVKAKVANAKKDATKMLLFSGDSVAPVRTIGGVNKRVLGLHYRFIQDNLGTKLGDAEPDLTIEGTLAEEYEDMTGREFLDSFDLVISPTKANDYKYKDLRQARANDTGLTNIIYGETEDGTKNTFSKTWEGKITDEGHQSTLANMGLSKKDEVPDVLTGLNGKKGTVASKA